VLAIAVATAQLSMDISEIVGVRRNQLRLGPPAGDVVDRPAGGR